MEDNLLTFGSLFTGGGGLDLGLERAGFKCRFMVENDKSCLKLLGRKWPHVPKNEIRPIMGIVGGDPCPIRSKFGRLSKTSSPDLSGYFLAMAARCEPWWLLRENVPAPDVVEFQTALDMLGYKNINIRLSAQAFTAQSRNREYIISFKQKSTLKKFESIFNKACFNRINQTGRKKQMAFYCISTESGTRSGGKSNNYVYEKKKGIRSLTNEECESLQGFPRKWTSGLSKQARERIIGNAVCVPVAEFIGQALFKTLKALDYRKEKD